jgi:hypothetical protein
MHYKSYHVVKEDERETIRLRVNYRVIDIHGKEHQRRDLSGFVMRLKTQKQAKAFIDTI